MTGDEKAGGWDMARLAHAAEALRAATADALATGSWFAPTLDDCRLDAERLVGLGGGATETAVHAVLVRADLALRTWHKLATMTRYHTPPPRPCPLCGEGMLRPVARPGRTAPFRGVRLEIPADFAIPTCDRCQGESLDADTAARLDDKLLSAWTWRQR
jgi:hypothetical protein